MKIKIKTKQLKLYNIIIKKISNFNEKNYIFLFFLLATLIIIWKLFSYTILNNDFYTQLADNQQIWEITVPVTRWTIYSKESSTTIMWTSLNLYDVAVDPQSIWNKEKLTTYLTNIVFNELCFAKTVEECYENTLTYLRVLEIEKFEFSEDNIKKLIYDRLKEKIYQEKVTSVFVNLELTEEKINRVNNSNLKWVYVVNDYLYLNPEEIKWNKYTIDILTDILWYKKEDVESLVRQRNLRYVQILKKISISSWEKIKLYLEEESIAIKKWILNKENSIWNFIILEPNPHRYYPENNLAAQVIWFVDNEWVGHYWIEWYFDEILQWNSWKIVSRKDTQWRTIDTIWLETEDFVSEWTKIYTTIDRNIQNRVEYILEEGVKSYRANKWTIVVMEPQTWRILAMANYPTYDLNNYSDVYEIEKVKYSQYPDPKIDLLGYPVYVEDSENGILFYYDSKEIYLREATRDELWDVALVKYKYKNDFWPQIYTNDAISSLYEPWSIMKAFTVAIWLDTWEITRYWMYQDDWKVQIWDFTIANVMDECIWYHTFAHALNYSCNVWMIRIVQRLWKVLLYQYLNDFWFSETTNITLSWEVTWKIKPRERWSMAQLLTTSYWLWVSLTPLQMANAYSILANGWVYIRPRIIDKIEYSNGKIVEYKNEIIRRVIKESTSETITQMLNSSINDWAAKNWNVEWFSLAWKTWTSQISYRGGYEEWVWSTIASFAWYWPVEDPQFVIIVKLERPRTNEYGWSTSANLFKQVAEYLLDYMGVPKKG